MLITMSFQLDFENGYFGARLTEDDVNCFHVLAKTLNWRA